jgi:hypothetical protein
MWLAKHTSSQPLRQGGKDGAALRWFHQPVVEIKQISAYSCRGMNGNPDAQISEHAFGNPRYAIRVAVTHAQG